jgi:dephospho-CoA kinase
MIIGITGSLGGGKGTVVDYLINQKNFKHYSSSDHLIRIIEARGEVVDRDAMNRVANELRADNPAGVPAETYKLYCEDDGESDVILESLHSVPEVEFIKSVGGIVIAITADSDIRYERITTRGSVKDDVTKEQFIAQQEREEKGSEDPNKSNIFHTIKAADFTIENNGTLVELQAQVEAVLAVLEEAD